MRIPASLLLILAGYLVFGVGFVFMVPCWQNPDEPAHYNVIQQIAEHGHLPVLEAGDYDQAFLEEIVRRGFPPDMDPGLLRYEEHQPPLYYLLALPVYHLGRGRVVPLRLFSLLLGAGLVIGAWLSARTAAPGRPEIAAAAAAFVAFLPQHTAMMASINNDALAGLLMTLVLWLALRERLGRSAGLRERVLLGLLTGLALLTKLSVAVAWPVAVLAVLGRRREEGIRPSPAGHGLLRPDLLPVLLLPLLVALPWWLRNLQVYGWPDLLGQVRHAVVAAGQPQTAAWIASHGVGAWLQRLAVFTFQSFWGQFGWMAVPMHTTAYRVLLVFCGLLAGGWLLHRFFDRPEQGPLVDGRAVRLLCFSLSLTLVAYLGYNLHFVQHQGRYLFSGIVPLSLAVAVAWTRLCSLGGSWTAGRCLSLFCLLLICLNLYVFVAVLPHVR